MDDKIISLQMHLKHSIFLYGKRRDLLGGQKIVEGCGRRLHDGRGHRRGRDREEPLHGRLAEARPRPLGADVGRGQAVGLPVVAEQLQRDLLLRGPVAGLQPVQPHGGHLLLPKTPQLCHKPASTAIEKLSFGCYYERSI